MLRLCKMKSSAHLQGGPRMVSHNIFCEGYENGGLKSKNFKSKQQSLMYSSVKVIYDKNFPGN